MPTRQNLAAAAPWAELAASAEDRDTADPDLLLGQALWIRMFEEHALELAGQGLVPGPAHSSIGQDGGAVGSLRSDDCVNGSHRLENGKSLADARGEIAYVAEFFRWHSGEAGRGLGTVQNAPSGTNPTPGLRQPTESDHIAVEW
ncbi:hypothetical protein [Saccharopolyspora soli]|uniref:hypothetical protein n=1 Tax=Saccharopolyspora soli TaxID=2926618 RepID=UPI0027DF5A24|nr:hypothetical protein [Saccharopolyspora soli]